MKNSLVKKNVLLVDDEMDICDFLCEYVEDKNLNAYQATDIETALEIATKIKVDLVLLDNNLLSNVQGVEYIPEFKLRNDTCKVFILTANTRAEVFNRAQELGADGFIAKPFDFSTLDNALDCLHP